MTGARSDTEPNDTSGSGSDHAASSTSEHPIPVIGIGASAGGLESLQEFFAAMPANSGAAFVVVQHLQHGRKSRMPEILADYTSMPVCEATDQTHVRANTVHVLPADSVIAIHDGVLVLEGWGGSEPRRAPIDEFFRSLAADQGRFAVAIIMSGAGSDGTRGVRAVKDHGGLALAEALVEGRATPGFSSMPNSAAATGLVDFVVPAGAMPPYLADYVQHLRSLALEKRQEQAESEAARILPEVTALLLTRMKRDFRDYKRNTLVRRTQRRMQILQIDNGDDYLARLREDHDEPAHLANEFLVSVTSFFRDPEAFESLKVNVLRPLIAERAPDARLRIWVPACGTGEEAYAIAMLVAETRAELDSHVAMQIFATDIDPVAIETARAGRYPKSIAADVRSDRLETYFTEDDDSFRVVKDVRDACVFSQHDIIQNPPFSQLDLISCRNLLIYMDGKLQKRLIPVFHYALRAGGAVFLGPSENLTYYDNLFTTIDPRHKIFRRRDHVARPQLEFPLPVATEATAQPRPRRQDTEHPLAERAAQIVLNRYGPAYVVVDDAFNVVEFSQGTAPFLEQPAGAPRTNVLEMARAGLRSGLRTALYKAVHNRVETVQSNLAVSGNDGSATVDVVVTPLSESNETSLYLVVFRSGRPAQQTRQVQAVVPERDLEEQAAESPETRIQALERELAATREDLHATIEELETSNEELQSANEELLSMNEELQSSNEELETSKEEVQSVNEELETINEELNHKISELNRLNDDLHNLLESTDIATLFLDPELRVKWFSPATRRLFNLIETDVGRPITDISTRFGGDNLEADLKSALAERQTHERTVTLLNNDRTYYTMRVRPYWASTGSVEGVVLTFQDITDMTEAARQQKLLVAALQHRVRNVLATVRSLARETRERSDSLDGFFERFEGRMRALATSETIVARTSEGVVDLFELVQEALPRALHLGEQVSIAGPHLDLAPRAGQMLALALNELATNAIKFGALSGDGAIRVSWTKDSSQADGELRLTWEETGAPEPCRSPAERGFGLALIEEGVPYELGGSARVTFGDDGVRCDFAIPASGNLTAGQERADGRGTPQ